MCELYPIYELKEIIDRPTWSKQHVFRTTCSTPSRSDRCFSFPRVALDAPVTALCPVSLCAALLGAGPRSPDGANGAVRITGLQKLRTSGAENSRGPSTFLHLPGCFGDDKLLDLHTKDSNNRKWMAPWKDQESSEIPNR